MARRKKHGERKEEAVPSSNSLPFGPEEVGKGKMPKGEGPPKRFQSVGRNVA